MGKKIKTKNKIIIIKGQQLKGREAPSYLYARLEVKLDERIRLIVEICGESGGFPSLVLQSELGQSGSSLFV